MARLQRSDEIVERTIADETFLLPVKGDLAAKVELFALSEVGRFVWGRIDGMQDAEQIVAAVVEEFDVDESQARQDVVDFLRQMQEHGLIAEVTD